MRTVRGWLHTTAGGLPPTFWYLWAGTLVNRIGSFVIIFLAIYLTAVRGFSTAFAGLVLGIYGAGGGVGVLVGGVLADRGGRRGTLLIAHVTAASAMLALGLVRAKYPVLGVALLLGTATEMARPAFAAMMVDVVPERDRLRAFTLNYWAINLGFASAAVLAGYAAAANYLLLFIVDATTTLITAGIVFAKVGETRPVRGSRQLHRPEETTRPVKPAPGLRAVFADRVFLTFVGLNLLLAVVFIQHISSLPIAMSQDGLAPATYGSVIALNGVLIVSGQLFVPRLIGGRNRSHVLALAAAVVGLGFGLTAAANQAWLYALTVLIWTAGEMLSSPSTSTLLAELSPTEMRGRYQGVFSLAWSLASFIAPIAGGFVQEHSSDSVLWLGCAGIAALVAAGHLVSGPARERRADLLRTGPPAAASAKATPAPTAAASRPPTAPGAPVAHAETGAQYLGS